MLVETKYEIKLHFKRLNLKKTIVYNQYIYIYIYIYIYKYIYIYIYIYIYVQAMDIMNI